MEELPGESAAQAAADALRPDGEALKIGNVTLNTTAPDLTPLTDAETNLRIGQLDSNLTRHALNQLIGLDPNVHLRLIGPASQPPLWPEQFGGVVTGLLHRCSDRLTLKGDYQAQDQSVSQATLAQFPV